MADQCLPHVLVYRSIYWIRSTACTQISPHFRTAISIRTKSTMAKMCAAQVGWVDRWSVSCGSGSIFHILCERGLVMLFQVILATCALTLLPAALCLLVCVARIPGKSVFSLPPKPDLWTVPIFRCHATQSLYLAARKPGRGKICGASP